MVMGTMLLTATRLAMPCPLHPLAHMQPSGSPSTPYGQNLAQGSAATSCAFAVQQWASSMGQYSAQDTAPQGEHGGPAGDVAPPACLQTPDRRRANVAATARLHTSQPRFLPSNPLVRPPQAMCWHGPSWCGRWGMPGSPSPSQWRLVVGGLTGRLAILACHGHGLLPKRWSAAGLTAVSVFRGGLDMPLEAALLLLHWLMPSPMPFHAPLSILIAPCLQATTQVGCGLGSCPQGGLVVCFYSPPGNVAGQYQQNV